MKNEALKKLIKEEILSMLEVDAAAAAPAKNAPSEVVNLIKYLQGTGKSSLSQINNPFELKQILDAIFAGMNPTMMKNAGVLSVKEIIDMKLYDAAPAKKAPSEVVNLIKYLQGTGKTPLYQINSPSKLKQILDAIFAGMDQAMMEKAGVLPVKKIIDMKL